MECRVKTRRQYLFTLEEEEANGIAKLADYVQLHDFEDAVQRSGKKGTKVGADAAADLLDLVKEIRDLVAANRE